MKKRILCLLLTLTMAISLLPGVALATDVWEAEEVTSDYFYKQLNDRAKAIYDKLLNEFTGKEGKGKETYYDGKEIIDLIGLTYGANKDKTIDKQEVEAYRNGNKDLFNDFCAAKDALDLDHSELWYLDSGFFTFQVTSDSNGYHVLIGPGRGPTYLLAGQTTDDITKLGTGYTVASMDKEVNEKIDSIVKEAVNALNANSNAGTYTKQDKIAYLVTHIHDSITKGIHYRYEIECRDNGKFAKYIRTLYGIVSHEGVCEAYSRTLQVALRRAGIECVLIHGVQSKGTPEDHMWNAVNIPDDDGTAHWYVVDATWDDPLAADWYGRRDLTFNNGLDEKETNTYLLVGQSTVGEYWNPSGYVSTGNFEFKYPTIETASYTGATVHGDDNGLKIYYSAGGAQEDDIPAGVFGVTYKGWDAAEARKHGLYFMVKMYDYHPDGTADVMDEWYYADATFAASSNNPYFGDFGGTLRISTSTCEYVEIAVTTREPEGIETWGEKPDSGKNALTNNPMVGYFQGDESEIVAQSGMLYNVNSTYEAPPYVKTQYPAPNGNATAGYTYRFKVIYDDLLYHILPSDINAASGIETADMFQDNYEQAKKQTVQVRYTTDQQDLHDNYAVKFHQVAGELPFDKDRDGIVDMTDKTYTDFKWIYAMDPDQKENWGLEKCPNPNHPDGGCDVTKGCPVVGVEFNFRASDQWIDDVTQYTFIMEGLVGSRSSKFPNNFSVIAIVPGLCPACYRSQGIDWNLWGQPTLLDAPENLDLKAMAEAGGTDAETLKKLDEEMNRDDLNGRLMLVVQDKSKGSGSREDYEKINDELTGDGGELEGEEVSFSSVFEINFNRICPMVKLKPNQGQSLRVQVGYPAGITYESLGRGEYDIQAYHFTRCADNETDRCQNYTNENHKWGDDIVRVEKITVIPTPYGMVIMCDAFSPFEIVAIKKDEGSPATIAANEHDVIVVSDMNGKVKVGNDYAIGEKGNQKVVDGASFEFSVEPKEGYVVNTVSFGGKEVTEVSENKYKIESVKESDVLNVTFVPSEVKEEEEKVYGTAVIAQVCTHPEDQIEKFAEDGEEAKQATCTTAGYELGTRCKKCGTTLTTGHEIPATGHQAGNPEAGKEAVAATCTTPGKTAEIKCTVCGDIISNQSDIQALGHLFKTYTETKEKTCQGTVTTSTCERCKNATDKGIANYGWVDHDFSVSLGKTPATCTEDSLETFQCKWCKETTIVRDEGTATGHNWGDDGYCTVCQEYLCKNGHNEITLEEVKPTCTDTGLTEGKKCTVCGKTTVEQSVVPALGHTFNKNHECEVCGTKMVTPEHTPVKVPGFPATCTTDGLTDGQQCSGCGEWVEKQTVIPKLDHEYDDNSVRWVWSETNGVSATMEIKCTVGNHVDTFNAETKYVEIKKPTCTDDGEGSYTATVEVNGKTYTDTDEKKTLPIPATGHKFNTTPVATTEATCAQHATKTYKCDVCGDTETFIDNETPLKEHQIVPDHTKSIPATCTEPGKSVGVCAVCGEEGALADNPTIPALGHSFGSYRVTKEATCTEDGRETSYCSRCGASTSRTVKAKGHNFVDGVCSVCGEKDPDYKAEPWVNPFPDVVPEKDWFAPYLETVTQRELFKGDEKGNFNPGMTFGRGQLMTVLARLDGVNTEGGSTWYAKGMDWAVANKISDGTNPEKPLAREDFVTMLWRYMGEPEAEGKLDFPDADTVDSWAGTAMIWAVRNGIINGMGDGTLNPRGEATRAEAVTIISRFLEKFDL